MHDSVAEQECGLHNARIELFYPPRKRSGAWVRLKYSGDVVNSSNTVKVIAAFAGGIVVALGSALIYVKAHEPGTQQALVQTAPPPNASEPASLPDADHGSAPSTDQGAPPAEQAPAEVHKAPAARREAKAATERPHRKPQAVPADEDQPPVLVAQNSAAPAAAPPPAANPAPNPYASAPPPPAPSPDLAPAPAPAPPVRQPRTMTIPSGTVLSIRLGEKLSTDVNTPGDAFRGSLEAPLILNGAVIADRGSRVLGKVVNAEKAGKVKGVSDLQLALTEINTTDGQRVDIQTATLDKQGPTGRAKDAAKVGGGAALGAIIGAIAGGGKGAAIGSGVGGAAGAGDVLLTRGKAVVIPTETKLSFQLSAAVTITERLNTNQ